MKGESKRIYTIGVATALVMTFIMFMGCMYKDSIKYYESIYGPFHTEVVLRDKDLYKKIERQPLVRDTAYVSIVRYRLCNDKTVTYDRSSLSGVGVGSLTKDVLKLFKVELSSGRLPKNNKEIILSDYYDIGEGSIKVGDEVELKLDAKSEPDIYTVVGTYKDNIRMSQYNEDEHLNEEINAFTYDEKAKVTDGSVVYVRCFNTINMNPYQMMRKLGIKNDDIYTNSELINVLNINELLEYNIKGPMIVISQTLILFVSIIVAYILLLVGFKNFIKKDIDEDTLNKCTTEVEKKKYISDIADATINKNILIGLGIGTMIAIVINVIVCFFSEPIMNNCYDWYHKLNFRISIVALLIGITVADIIICLAKKVVAKKIYEERFVEKSKLVNRNNTIGIVISTLIIIACIVTTFALDKKFMEPVNSYRITFVDDSINYDIRVSDEGYIETNPEMPEYGEENEKKVKAAIGKNYERVKKELSAMPVDEMITMAVESTNEAYIDEYNSELKKIYEKAWIDYENVKSAIKLKEIYLDEEHYKALIKDNNLKEDKYIGEKNSPAIVFNVRRLYEDSHTYYDGKILKDNQKELKTKKGKIKIGDMINTYVEDIQPEAGFLEGSDVLYVCYPESSMKEINAFTIDLRVDNYDKVDAKFNEWYKKNSSADMVISTPTARLREETEIYRDKMSKVYLICGSIALIAMLNILRIKLKKIDK